MFESILAILFGIGLAASCGFRVFVPLLVASSAALAGYVPLSEGFEWLATWPALVAFAIAAVIEIGAFYVPWLDNFLDTVASPAAVVAGAVLFAATMVELDPFAQWTLAVIAGGGSAAIVQGSTVATRLASTGTTGGLANFAVATIETLAGIFFSTMSILVPLLSFLLLLAALATMFMIARPILRRLFARETTART